MSLIQMSDSALELSFIFLGVCSGIALGWFFCNFAF